MLLKLLLFLLSVAVDFSQRAIGAETIGFSHISFEFRQNFENVAKAILHGFYYIRRLKPTAISRTLQEMITTIEIA